MDNINTETSNNQNIQIGDEMAEDVTIIPCREKSFIAETLVSIDKIEPKYRYIFSNYMYFNRIQSSVFNSVLNSDESLVVSAPTGSGKTVIFELAIIKFLRTLELMGSDNDYKIIYVAPMKALCEERLLDWHKKFSPIGVSCVSATGDSENISFANLLSNNLIITTPEKWDSLTRHWKNHTKFVKTVGLFMIDEVHLLNDESRGPTLEAIVSRMKTIKACMNNTENGMRFLAVSATIPNVEDIAEWIGTRFKAAKYYSFDEETRPVKLTKIVLGYQFNPQMSTPFKFDIMLSYKLQNVILQYSNGKPTLIFCSTRKSVEMTAKYLVQNLSINLSQVQKANLQGASFKVSEALVKETLVHGVGCHHAGMLPENRLLIEQLFRNSELPILVTTSTLAMGVNLPAHLVIIKSTKQYMKGEYKDYSESALLQMIGRAGRPQFDRTATAVILTTAIDKPKFENIICGVHPVESSLHKHLAEHLNAEVVLRTITDLGVAMQWLTSSFLYIRARKHPKYYGLPIGLMPDQIDKKLLDICQIEINKLAKAGMITIDFNVNILPTEIGTLMAKYYVHFETMRLFKQVSGKECLRQILAIISRCHEYSDMCLRGNDKKALNLLNKCKNRQTIRFPLIGKIKTLDMKINCIIQAVFGCLEILEPSLLTEAQRIMRIGERLANCLAEYLVLQSQCYSALLNALLLAKCFHTRIWENSPYVSRQLVGIGAVMSANLVAAGKTTFDSLLSSNPRNLEIILHRKSPMGNTIQDQIAHLPQYEMILEEIKLSPTSSKVKLTLRLKNYKMLEDKLTLNPESVMNLLIGDDDNNIILFEKYTHMFMVENPYIWKELELEFTCTTVIHAHFISENWVGIDCHSTYSFNDETKSKPKENQLESKVKETKCKERPKVSKKLKDFIQPNSSDKPYVKKFIDQYFKIAKKSSNKKNSEKSDNIPLEKVSSPEIESEVSEQISEKQSESENEANLLKEEDSDSPIEEENLDLEEKLLESSDAEIETAVVEAEEEPDNDHIQRLIQNSTADFAKICNKDVCPENSIKIISNIAINKDCEDEKKKSIDKFIEAKIKELDKQKSIDTYQRENLPKPSQNTPSKDMSSFNASIKLYNEAQLEMSKLWRNNQNENLWESENIHNKKESVEKVFKNTFDMDKLDYETQNVQTNFLNQKDADITNEQNQRNIFFSKVYSNPSLHWGGNSGELESFEYQNTHFEDFAQNKSNIFETNTEDKHSEIQVFNRIQQNDVNFNPPRLYSTPKMYAGIPKRKLTKNKYLITEKSAAFEDSLYTDSNSPQKLNIKETFSYTPKKKLAPSKFDPSSVNTEPDSTNSSEYHVTEILTPKRLKLDNNQECYQLRADRDGKKSITWSSPLVTSPGMKYSPNILSRTSSADNNFNNNLEFSMESKNDRQSEELKPSSSNRKINSQGAKYSNFPLRSRKNISNLPITDKECSYSENKIQNRTSPFEKFNDILSSTLIETLDSSFNSKENYRPKTAEKKEIKVIEQNITSYVVNTQKKKSNSAVTSTAADKTKSDNLNLSVDLYDFFNDDFPESQLNDAAKEVENQNFETLYNNKNNSADGINSNEYVDYNNIKSVSEYSPTDYRNNRNYPRNIYSADPRNNVSSYTRNYPSQIMYSDSQEFKEPQNYEMPLNRDHYGNISKFKDYSGFYDKYILPSYSTSYQSYQGVAPHNSYRNQNSYNCSQDMFSSDPYNFQEDFPNSNSNHNILQERFGSGPFHDTGFLPNHSSSQMRNIDYTNNNRCYPLNWGNNVNNRYHVVEDKCLFNSGQPRVNLWGDGIYDPMGFSGENPLPVNSRSDNFHTQKTKSLDEGNEHNSGYNIPKNNQPQLPMNRNFRNNTTQENSSKIVHSQSIIRDKNIFYNKSQPLVEFDDKKYIEKSIPMYEYQRIFPKEKQRNDSLHERKLDDTNAILSVDRHQIFPHFNCNNEIFARDINQRRDPYPNEITERSNYLIPRHSKESNINGNINQNQYNPDVNFSNFGPEPLRDVSNGLRNVDRYTEYRGNHDFHTRSKYRPPLNYQEFPNHSDCQSRCNRDFPSDKRFVMNRFFES